MALTALSPHETQARLKAGAILLDVREADEHARERIPQARHHALSQLNAGSIPRGAPVIFHCRTGNRTLTHAARLAEAASDDAFLLDGGIDGWKAAGFSTIRDAKQPLELMRQVQIAAGSLVLVGVGLGAVLNPLFYAISGFVGAGLAFAGLTGTCGMARMLALAPWNRRAAFPQANV